METQRYSGPELSDVLKQVRADLGHDAVIHEANKVRSGGVAGFFANEHFEVLAAPRAASPEPAWTIPATTGRSTGDALLERAERVSTLERIEQLSEPSPQELGGEGFTEILDRLLDDQPAVVAAAGSTATATITAPAPVAAPVSSRPDVNPVVAPATPVIDVRDPRPADAPSLWARLAAAGRWRSPALDHARVSWFVGPRERVVPIEVRFGPMDDHDLLHLSDRPGDVPAWSVARDLDEARGRGRRWQELGVSGSVIWDQDVFRIPPHRFAEIVVDEANVLRIVTDDLRDLDHLQRICDMAQVPVVIDLDTPPPSAQIVEAFDRGLPIASILGMRVTPELVVAIQLDAGHG